jgi:hypothetical protein
MLERLKNQPLVGLALAICSGLIAACVIISLSEYIHDEWIAFSRHNPGAIYGWILVIAVLAGVAYLIRQIVRKRRRLAAMPRSSCTLATTSTTGLFPQNLVHGFSFG